MWNPLSRLFAQRRPPASDPPATTLESDPLDQLIRESFPRAAASEALQARVAALLPAQKPVSRVRLLPQLNAPSRWAVALTLGGLLIVAGLSAGRRGPVAYAE